MAKSLKKLLLSPGRLLILFAERMKIIIHKQKKKIVILAITIFFLCILITLFIIFLSQDNKTIPIHKKKEIPEQEFKYGLPVDSFVVLTGVIRRNETLGEVLSLYNVPASKIAQIHASAKGIFSPRMVQAGNSYTLFCNKDEKQTAQYLVYEHSIREYFLFDLTGQVNISKHKRPERRQRKYFSTAIETSLWDAMLRNNTNPMLAIELSDIYAWTIDFFMLSPDDHIYTIYDETFVSDQSTGISRILAARFDHADGIFYAFPFMQDSTVSYFDENGNSLRKQFLKAPLRFSRISSRFSGSRLHPVLRIRRPHYGVDYTAPVGTPVHSIGDGVVISMGYSKGNGHMVKIRHNATYTSAYLHLSRYGKNIRKGAKVKQSQILGYVGSTGLSTGPHLDFRIWKHGHPVDPLKIKSPPTLPIKPENQAAFDSVKTYWMQRLKRFNPVVEEPELYD